MLKKILFCKNTNRAVNLMWLFVLWCIVYAFTAWNYGAFHFIRPRDTPEQMFSTVCLFLGFGVLWIEFSLNFPSKYIASRVLCGLIALIGLLAALPTF